MKINLGNSLLVVEGKSDVNFLKQFLEVNFYTTNGSDLSKEKILYLKQVSQSGKQIIVLTDPDFPGEKIRKEINQNIPESINVFLPKEKCLKKDKCGVAECDKETILEALSKIKTNGIIQKKYITIEQLNALGLSGNAQSKKNRQQICDRLNLGFCNSKTMIKRLYNMGIDFSKLEEVVKAYGSK